MDDFALRMDLRGALELYLFLEEQEDELDGASEKLFAALRAYLYDHLSIEEMESPRTLLETL
jgi:hypothetical protein